MGVVYRAKDRRLKRTVAIKVLPPELAFRSEIKTRFLREAETAAQLNHPNIVDIYAVDEAEGIVYFVIDRKSTRLNSSHRCISYAVFCLKKKTLVFISNVVLSGSLLTMYNL